MRLPRWLMLIGVLVGLGCLQVAQRNAVTLQGYAVGERLRRVHAEETAVSWLQTEVRTLASPSRLAQVSDDRQLKLVAWSPLPPTPSVAGVIPTTMSQRIEQGGVSRLASVSDLASVEGR